MSPFGGFENASVSRGVPGPVWAITNERAEIRKTGFSFRAARRLRAKSGLRFASRAYRKMNHRVSNSTRVPLALSSTKIVRFPRETGSMKTPALSRLPARTQSTNTSASSPKLDVSIRIAWASIVNDGSL
jgi:hypothetical protein